MIQKGLWRMLGVSLLALVPARIIYTMCFYDPDNGVYRDGGGWGYLLIILFLLAGAVLFFMCRQDNRAVMEYSPKTMRGPGMLALISGVALLYQSVSSIVVITGEGHGVGSASPVGSQPLVDSLTALIGIIAAVCMMCWGGSLLNRGSLFADYPLVGLAAPVWACFNLAVLFINYTAVSSNQDNFYVLVPYCFAAVFLFHQGNCFSRVGGPHARRKLYQYGAPFILLGLGSSLPSLVAAVFGLPSSSSIRIEYHIVLFCLSLYALSLLWKMRRDTRMLLRGRKPGSLSPAFWDAESRNMTGGSTKAQPAQPDVSPEEAGE